MAKGKKLDPDGQDRKFVMMLYEDSETYDLEQVILRVTEYADEWSYIRHDKDVESVLKDGVEVEEKIKPHYHVCMRFPTPRIRSTVANNLGIAKNYIQRAENGWRAVNRYLIHLDHDDRYQYPYYDVASNFDYLEVADKKRTETDKVNSLIDFVVREKCYSVVKLGNFARENDLWDAYRRNYIIMKDIMFELKDETRRKEQYEEEKRLREKFQRKMLIRKGNSYED